MRFTQVFQESEVSALGKPSTHVAVQQGREPPSQLRHRWSSGLSGSRAPHWHEEGQGQGRAGWGGRRPCPIRGGGIEARALSCSEMDRRESNAWRGFDQGPLLFQRLLRCGICPLLMESIAIDPAEVGLSQLQMTDPT